MTFPFTVKPLLSEITLGCGYSKYCFEYSKEYLRIMNVAKEKEYATLSSAAILLKLAVYPVIQSIRNNPELYISLN